MPELANTPTRAVSGRRIFFEFGAELLGDCLAECEFVWIAMMVAVVAVLVYVLWNALGGNTPKESDLVTLLGTRR